MEKRTRPYEALVRVNADGSVVAHAGYIEEIVDGSGGILFAKELPVQPLDLAGAEFGPLVDALNSSILAENAALKAALAEELARSAVLARELDALRGAAGPLEAPAAPTAEDA